MKYLPLFFMLTAALFGCGESEGDPEVRQSAQQAYDDAIASMEAKDYEAASESLKVALVGDLPSDLFVDAGFRQAKCLSELGEYDDALMAIDAVEEGADGEDQVHLARCEVYLKQGDRSKAQDEFKRAKKHNPKAKKPAGL